MEDDPNRGQPAEAAKNSSQFVAEDMDVTNARALFSEYMSHARHLENYLLSFTQVFLLITGALWGFALVHNPLSPTPSVGIAPPTNQSTTGTSLFGTLPVLISVFGFHLLYSFVGLLFSVRCAVNFRKNFEMARKILQDAGLAEYTVYVYPEGPAGTIEPHGVLSFSKLLLTAKAFLTLLFPGAAAVDTYLGLSIAFQARWAHAPVYSLCISVSVALLFLILAIWAYKKSSKEITPRHEV